MKTRIALFPFIKYIVLAAILIAACSTGNDFVILAAVAALLFVLVGDNSDNHLISKLMFAGAVLGLIISHSVVRLVDTSHHKGPGFVDLAGDDSAPDVEKVSESQYKRHEYGIYGLLFGFGVMFWFMVAGYAKGIYETEKEKRELEKSWARMILNPKQIQDIRRHPRSYRDDFKQWITEIRPDLLHADAESENWFRTGDKFYFGEGGAKDANEAVNWYRKAAERNHVLAQYALGDCYYYGEGIAKDVKEAVNWYRKAAEQNHAPAQHALGFCYDNGQGVTLNAEAVRWYRKAAEQNFAVAQNNLGFCYEKGHGVQQDLAEAYMFYKLATQQTQEKTIMNLTRLTAKMTTVEIAEGERRVIEFRSQNL